MGKRDDLYLLKGMVEYDEAYVEKATNKVIQDRLKRGKGSQKQAIVAVASESTPLEDPTSGQKGRHCGFFKLKVLGDVTKESVEDFVKDSIDPKSVLFTDKNTAYVNLEKMVAERTAVLAQIEKIEADKDFSNPKYMELLLPNFYEKHILRFPAKDWPEPVNRSFGKMNQSLYVTMQGPSEFGISGKLENWDRTNDLKDIKIPTLVIGATHDTMDPKFMEKMSTLFPKGSFLLCSKGSHMAFYDDQKTYFNGLISFLKN